jgi:UDP-N-acetylmuramoyl-tripeptide--D-alanyl-D-alanine ligase
MLKIAELYQLFLQTTGVSTDTRDIKEGSMFFALKGVSFNGNQFAGQALASGAKFVVVDEPEVVTDHRFILVDEVLEALQMLAGYHRKQLGIPIIGITGTNGKTTTKELIKAVLETKYKVFATVGNFNNHIGVPLTILAMNREVEMGIVEMGANHQGEIEQLCHIAQPDYGLITNVGKAHLEGFGSFEGVMKTKAELYKYIEAKQGTLFVNASNDYLLSMLGEGADLYRYGKNDSFNVFFKEFVPGDFLGAVSVVKGKEIILKSNLVGTYNLENILAAVAVGNCFEVENSAISKAIANYRPQNNRSQLVETKTNKVLFDAYNANPTSMQAALDNFVQINRSNKVVILGEMRELGEGSYDEHASIISFLQSAGLHKVILIGESYKPFIQSDCSFLYYDNVEMLIDALRENMLTHCFILVKGSRTNKLEKLKGVL